MSGVDIGPWVGAVLERMAGAGLLEPVETMEKRRTGVVSYRLTRQFRQLFDEHELGSTWRWLRRPGDFLGDQGAGD